ncbi:fungal-specific transcription factor domain-containing protein [Limtongia smithiae]|uniref:fungal-specific transcription factor domain-containing protein n=1 Tax=Limtongia smithiae TaxID=1125753 RepID=UPI0034D013A2
MPPNPPLPAAAKKPAAKPPRSSIACKRCHASKIRCDIAACGPPCSRCRHRGFDDCQRIESRRGLYDRKEWMRKIRAAATTNTDTTTDNTTITTAAATVTTAVSAVTEPPAIPVEDDITTINPPRSPLRSPTRQLCFVFPDHPAIDPHLLATKPYSFLRAAVAAAATAPDDLPHGAPAGQWSVVFRYFINDATETADRNLVSYFGESFPGGLLRSFRINDPADTPQRPKPARICASITANPTAHPPHISPSKLAFLESEGCFTKPPKDVLDQFITTYFQKVHPLYAIIERVAFMKMYREEKCPWLLLHAICFAAVTYCPQNLICARSRREARKTFYGRAKTLFDFSYEQNKIVLLQSAVLLSFWGGEPNDYWNTFSWINVAVNVAETLGIHRKRPYIAISDEDCGLWKRIWCCLVTRDSFCAALLGKPLRINLLQCDAEFWTYEDFASDADPGGEMWGSRVVEHGLYVMAMTDLTLTLREMVIARATSRVNAEFFNRMRRDFCKFQRNLPPAMRYQTSGGPETPHFVHCIALSLVYNHNVLYLHQIIPRPADLTDDLDPRDLLSSAAAHAAMSEIADLGSTLVTTSTIALLPQNAYAAFFMAIVMLFTQLRNNITTGLGGADSTRLLQSQLKICEMVVFQAQDHWDHADWVLAMAESLRQRLNVITQQDGVLPPQPKKYRRASMSTVDNDLNDAPPNKRRMTTTLDKTTSLVSPQPAQSPLAYAAALANGNFYAAAAGASSSNLFDTSGLQAPIAPGTSTSTSAPTPGGNTSASIDLSTLFNFPNIMSTNADLDEFVRSLEIIPPTPPEVVINPKPEPMELTKPVLAECVDTGTSTTSASDTDSCGDSTTGSSTHGGDEEVKEVECILSEVMNDDVIDWSRGM